MSETSVLFVCLGNICRSPLAEGVFLHLLAERGLSERYRVDSAGTSAYHAGEQADERKHASLVRLDQHIDLTHQPRKEHRVQPLGQGVARGPRLTACAAAFEQLALHGEG